MSCAKIQQYINSITVLATKGCMGFALIHSGDKQLFFLKLQRKVTRSHINQQ